MSKNAFAGMLFTPQNMAEFFLPCMLMQMIVILSKRTHRRGESAARKHTDLMAKYKHTTRSGPFCWVPRFVRLWFIPRRSLESLSRQIKRDGWPAQMVHNLKCPRCGADEIDDGTNNYPGGLV